MPVRISKNRVALENIPLNEAATVIVASAASTPIGAAASNNVDISGTTTITSFDNVADGINRKGRFLGALTLTHNATSLILPGSQNITTAANDRYEARSLGSGNWLVTKYEKADGTAVVVASTTSPAFAAHNNLVNQSIPSGVTTKVNLSTELFDTNNNFANSRFTPTVAGKYSLHAGIKFNSGAANLLINIALLKNGNILYVVSNRFTDAQLSGNSISAVVDANGSTDYFELGVLQNTGGAVDLSGNSEDTWFNGCKIG